MGIGRFLGKVFSRDERVEAEERLIRDNLAGWVRKYGDRYVAVSVSDGVDFDSDTDNEALHGRLKSRVQEKGRILVINPFRYNLALTDPYCMGCGPTFRSTV